MNAARESPYAVVRLIPWWAWLLIIVIMGPVMAWSSFSIFHACWRLAGVPWQAAWIPAAALDGVMLLMTPWSVNERLDRAIRQGATRLVVSAISCSVSVGFIDHAFAYGHKTPGAAMGSGLIGAAPNVMAAWVVHIVNKAVRQQFREIAALAAELINLETADGVRAENARRQSAADLALREDATRAAQDATQLRRRAERDRDAAATADIDAQRRRESALAALAEAEQAQRDAEAARKRAARRATRASASQPVATASQSGVADVSQAEASASQSGVADSSQTSTPEDRRAWALQQLRDGVKLRPRDIDARFEDGPRDGFRILQQARDQHRKDNSPEAVGENR